MVTINIQNKHLYLISAIMIFLVGVGLVVSGSYTSLTTGIGHDFDELEDVQKRVDGTCAEGSSIRAINTDGTVTCEDNRYIPSDVKATTEIHNGEFATSGIGYDDIDSWIQTNGCSGYHVCFNYEINSYMANTGTEVPEGWVQGGQHENHRSGAWILDCAGWTDGRNTGNEGVRGLIWSTGDNGVKRARCHLLYPVLCCK